MNADDIAEWLDTWGETPADGLARYCHGSTDERADELEAGDDAWLVDTLAHDAWRARGGSSDLDDAAEAVRAFLDRRRDALVEALRDYDHPALNNGRSGDPIGQALGIT